MASTSLDKLLALTVPEIQKVFLEMMQNIVDVAMIEEMVTAIENNDVEALYRASGFTPAVLGAILDVIERTVKEAADATVGTWPRRIITPAGPVTFRFDMRNPVTEEILKTKSSEFITRISDEVKENIRTMLQEGSVKGDNPRRVALDIVGRVNPTTKKREGGVIGLANNQVNWVNNARRYLERGDKKYFSLNLRDKRFDSVVQKAFDSGTSLDQDTVSKLLTAFKSNALRWRGENIARTEAIQAINRGEYEAHAQAIREGVLSRQQLSKEWDDVGDGRVRTTHRIMGEKYGKGKGIPFDQPFESPYGSKLNYPGDQSLGANPNEIIMCRCKQRIRVDWGYYAEEV